jgi:hypothetical protein
MYKFSLLKRSSDYQVIRKCLPAGRQGHQEIGISGLSKGLYSLPEILIPWYPAS